MTLRREKIVVSLVLAAIIHPTFQWVAAVNSTRSIVPPWWLVTPLDRALPVMPSAVWLYLSWYPASAIGLFTGRPTLRRMYVAYILAFAGCLLGYLVLPVTIQRPLISSDGLSGIVLRMVYSGDRPTNLFPSFHAAVAAILIHLRPSSKVLQRGLIGWMTVICAACVLTKQHYVLDVVAGVIVGFGAVKIGDAFLGQFVMQSAIPPLHRRRVRASPAPSEVVDPTQGTVQDG